MFWKAVVIASSCYQLKGLFLWQPEINLFVPLFLFLEEDQSTGSSIRTSDLPGTWDLDGRSAVRLNWFVITQDYTCVHCGRKPIQSSFGAVVFCIVKR